MSFENYFWDCRVSSYSKKVLSKSNTWRRKLITRCQKVGWDKIEEVQSLRWFEVDNYLRTNTDLLEKLWKLEFNTSIHS